VALILQTRSLFEEKYPAPVERVDLYPAPVLLNEGKSSEPDLVVTLRDGTQMLIECERETKKDEKKRREKWAKYFQATRGEFYIVGSNSKAVSALNSEITTWHMGHGGEVNLRLTSILQARRDPKFWVLDRELGKPQEHRR